MGHIILCWRSFVCNIIKPFKQRSRAPWKKRAMCIQYKSLVQTCMALENFRLSRFDRFTLSDFLHSAFFFFLGVLNVRSSLFFTPFLPLIKIQKGENHTHKNHHQRKKVLNQSQIRHFSRLDLSGIPTKYKISVVKIKKKTGLSILITETKKSWKKKKDNLILKTEKKGERGRTVGTKRESEKKDDIFCVLLPRISPLTGPHGTNRMFKH